MNDRDPASYTAAELAHPNTSAATLAQAAAVRPDLWSSILANPNCYPELGSWIREQQAAAPAPAAPAESQPSPGMTPSPAFRPDPVTGPDPAVGPTPVTGSNPAVGPNPVASSSPAVGPHSTVGPNSNFGSSPQTPYAISDRFSPQTAPTRTVAAGALLALLGITVLALVSLFLPTITVTIFGQSVSANVFAEGSDHTGTLYLINFGVVLLFAAIALTGQRWAQILTGIFGLLAGGYAAIDFIRTLLKINDAGFGISAGIGLYLLVFSAVVMVVLSIVVLASKKSA